jgi:hypothetical protein
MTLFCVGGIKTSSTLSLSLSLLPISTCKLHNSFTHPLYSPWPWFCEICWGFKEGFRPRALRVLVS